MTLICSSESAALSSSLFGVVFQALISGARQRVWAAGRSWCALVSYVGFAVFSACACSATGKVRNREPCAFKGTSTASVFFLYCSLRSTYNAIDNLTSKS